ncbi:MAG: putative porin [Oligoflexales bacterium]
MKRILTLILVTGFSPAVNAQDLAWSGDLRYRMEQKDFGEKGGTDPDADLNHRIRARFGVTAKPTTNLSLGFRIATGKAETATSTNQTLTGDFSKKPAMIDLAYFTLQPVPEAQVTAGKMKLLFLSSAQSDLVWDTDVTPEGLMTTYEANLGTVSLIPQVGHFLIADRAGKDDANMGMGGLGVRVSTDSFKLLFAGSLYSFSNLKGFEADAKGNSTDEVTPDGTKPDETIDLYAEKYEVQDLYLQVSTAFGSIPVTVFANAITNSKVDEENKGSLFGLKVGEAKGDVPWAVAYNYRKLESDATIGALTDADIGGGGTGVEGSKFQFQWAFNNNLTSSLTFFDAKKTVATNVTQDVDTYHLDFVASF